MNLQNAAHQAKQLQIRTGVNPATETQKAEGAMGDSIARSPLRRRNSARFRPRVSTQTKFLLGVRAPESTGSPIILRHSG
jgi:hypothetical protein